MTDNNIYTIPDSPKMLRETLCVAQARIGNSNLDESRKREHIARLQRLIDECNRKRPLGSNGKHGNLHTAECGCEDKFMDGLYHRPRSVYDALNFSLGGVSEIEAWCGVFYNPYIEEENGKKGLLKTCSVCYPNLGNI